MRPELQAKLLQHMNKKKGEKGFTLVELLVVIVIIGILTAIALPSFLNQTAKAKQAEAKQKISSILKTQQSFRTENPTFATAIDDLALGKLEGASTAPVYTYSLSGGTATEVGALATTTDVSVKSYSGLVAIKNVVSSDGTNNKVWNSVICEAKDPGATPAALPTVTGTAEPACAGTTVVAK
jgi:type IV pilus assembly protein PilA